MAILGVNKRAAIANAKLEVFEEALSEEDFGLPEFKYPQSKKEERTSQ